MIPFGVSASDGTSGGGFLDFVKSTLGIGQERGAFQTNHYLSNGPIELSGCGTECEHIIQGKFQNADTETPPNTIKITGGEHTIILDEVIINASVNGGLCPFEITGKAIVHLKLRGKNILNADKTAGILVGKDATLTIDTEDGADSSGSLQVTSKDGAGIGANNTDNFSVGTIEINHGTITAQGGNLGAGIGGNGSGSAGTIKINGGIIEATGGDNQNSGNKGDLYSPGIGCGANGVGGKLEVNGGTITARSGKNKSGKAATYDINGVELSSKENSGVVVDAAIRTTLPPNPPSEKDTKVTNFNGILKKKNEKNYYVYGNASVTDLTLLSDEKMYLKDNSSLSIPNSWSPKGTIIGNKTTSIVNADQIGADHGEIGGDIVKKKLMSHETVNANGQPYVGMDYNGKNELPRAIEVLDEVEINGDSYIVDKTGWDLQPKIERSTDQTSADWVDTKGEIKEAGYYKITYKRKEGATSKQDIVKNLTIAPQNLLDASNKPRIEIAPVPNQEYTGEQIVPELEITFPNGYGQKIPLVKDKDYILEPGENIKQGKGSVKIKAKTPGNFSNGGSDGITVEFTIIPATIPESAVKVTPESTVYDGEPHDAKVLVEMDGKELSSPTDYIVTKGVTSAIGAGNYEIEIEGQGNYQGKVKKAFTIQKRELNIASAVAVGRKYKENNREVDVEKVTLDTDNLADTDKPKYETEGFLGIAEGSITATIESPNVREDYDKIEIEEIQLSGAGKSNYTIKTPVTVPLETPIAITKADSPAAPTIKGHIEVGESGETFRYVIDEPENVKAEGEAVYEYGYGSKDDAEQGKIVCKVIKSEKVYFEDIEVGSKLVFAARKAETSNVKEGKTGYTEEVTFNRLPQKAPVPSEGEKFILEFEKDEEGTTSTATVTPKVKEDEDSSGDVEYRFKEADAPDDEWSEWQDSRVLKDCKANTKYVAQIRFKESKVYKAGDSAQAEGVSPKLKIETPTFSPNGGNFISSQKVTIECETEGVTIYYTTDGTEPSEGSLEYTGPFVLEESAEVNAIALKEGMEESEKATAHFVKAEGNLFTKLQIEKDITKVADGLKGDYKKPEDIKTELCRILADIDGYNYLDVAYYDVTLKISVDGKKYQVATIDDFPKEGLKVTMEWDKLDLPEDVGKDTHDFVVSHMFTETSKRLDVKAGETEEPEVKKTDLGLEFTIKSTSPVAVAWKKAPKASTNTGDKNNNNTNTNNSNNGSSNTNKGSDNTTTGKNNGTTLGGNTNTKAGTGSADGGKDNGNGTGTDGKGTNADGTKASGVKGAISSILPKTGDPTSIMIWVVLGIVSIGAVIAVIIKKRR